MVHALNEIHRVLILGGYLIDLRPFGDKMPVAVVSGDEILSAGYIDDSAGYQDDLAANAAIKDGVSAGTFSREKADTFGLYTYWDTAAAFKNYMDNRSTGILSPGTLAQIELLLSQHGPDARVCTHHHMIITRYRKLTSI